MILVVLTSLGVRELWTLLPYNADKHRYFPLYDIEMTLQTYLYFPCHFVANMMVYYAMGETVKDGKLFFGALFILQAVEFVDYFITYNTPWFQAFGIDFGVTLFRIFVMLIITLYIICRT